MRPKTLAEVAALAAKGDSFDRCLANFLDEFYAAPNAAALAADARAARPAIRRHGPRAGCLPRRHGRRTGPAFRLSQPAWTGRQTIAQLCIVPWFATPLAALRAVLLLESPPAFRARNLFVSENALSRA